MDEDGEHVYQEHSVKEMGDFDSVKFCVVCDAWSNVLETMVKDTFQFRLWLSIFWNWSCKLGVLASMDILNLWEKCKLGVLAFMVPTLATIYNILLIYRVYLFGACVLQ